MAQSYIGKIAGIVTLNTRDVTVGVNRSVKELDKLGGSIRSIISSSTTAAGKSFDAIFTPIQKLQAALRAAQQNPLKLVSDDEVRKINAITKATRDIFEPLGAGTKQFEQLATSVQNAFIPALRSAQNAALAVNLEIGKTGSASSSSFSAATAQIEKTTAALRRLAEAQNIARTGPQGGELALRAPRVNEALRGSAAVRGDIAALPSGKITGAIADQVANLTAIDKKIVDSQAKVERLQLRPKVDVSELRSAEAELEKLLAAQERVRSQLSNFATEDARKAAAAADRQKAVTESLAEDEEKRARQQDEINKQIDASLQARENARRNEASERKRDVIEQQKAAKEAIRLEDLRADRIVRRAQQQAKADRTAAASIPGAQTGDINTRGARRNTLAFQQLIFAVDDAASVTGGLEQRLRAAGNNLTQFGVLVGGTTGLVGALAAVLGTQAVLAIGKFTGAFDDAESRGKAFKDTLERQKLAAEGVSQALSEISAISANNPFSELTRGAKELEAVLARLKKAQRDAVIEERLGTAEGVQAARSRLVAAEKAFDENPNARTRREREVARLRLEALEQERRRDIAADLPPGSSQSRREVASAISSTDTAQRLSRLLSPLLEAAASGSAAGRRGVGTLESLQIELQGAQRELARAFGLENGPERRAAVRAAQENIDAINKEIDAREEGVAAARQFNASFKRLSETLDALTGPSRQAADAASQARDDARRVGLPGDRRRAELEAARAASLDATVQAEAEIERDRQRQRQRFDREITDREAQIDSLLSSTGVLAPGQREELIRERERIRAERRLNPEGFAPGVAAARDAAAREEERRQSAARGRELLLSSGQQAGRQLARDIADIRTAFDRDAELGLAPNAAVRDAAIARRTENVFRGIAPTLFGLQDQVQNAILRGPSRAALNPTDVSTVEGSRELTRLLRGDDEARNQDLVAINREQLEVQKAIRDNLDLRNAN